jgi:cytochrome c peroxidase
VYLVSTTAGGVCATLSQVMGVPPGEAIAVAYAGSELLVQIRDPAVLYFSDAHVTVPLSDVRRRDTGHAIFHANTGKNIACASCHLEGGEDGVTWYLPRGNRRTPSLRGTLAGTAPYHWEGELADLDRLYVDVLSTRMGGRSLSVAEGAALSGWLQNLPAPPPLAPQDPAKVARGRELFESVGVGCASCHSGERFTNNHTVDVGTGLALQVPSLVGLGWRAPYLHDGAAGTIRARFTVAVDTHGKTSQLSPADLDALVAYLETL